MHAAGSTTHYQSEREKENLRKEVRWIFPVPFMSVPFDLEAFTVGSAGRLQQDPDVRICSINFDSQDIVWSFKDRRGHCDLQL